MMTLSQIRFLLLLVLILLSACCTVSFSIPEVLHLYASASESASHAIPQLNHAAHAFPHAKTAAAALQHGGLVDPLTAYKHILQAHPLPTKMVTGATLAVCGDAIAQSKEKDVAYDQRRATSFAVFDMAYRALQHFSFPIIVAACHGQFLGAIPALETLDASQLAAMERTLASQLGIVPFLYYPAFFALTGAVQGLSTSGAMTRARENFIPLMKRNLLFWIPVQFVQFGYIQHDLQIPFLSVCGLGWTFILSVAAGSTKSYNTPIEDQVEELMSTAITNADAEADAVAIAEAVAAAVLAGVPSKTASTPAIAAAGAVVD